MAGALAGALVGLLVGGWFGLRWPGPAVPVAGTLGGFIFRVSLFLILIILKLSKLSEFLKSSKIIKNTDGFIGNRCKSLALISTIIGKPFGISKNCRNSLKIIGESLKIAEKHEKSL